MTSPTVYPPHSFRLIYLHAKAMPGAVVGANAKRVHDAIANAVGCPYNAVDVTPARDAWNHFQMASATGPRDYAGWPPYLLSVRAGGPRYTDAVLVCDGGEVRVGKATAEILAAFRDAGRAAWVVDGPDVWQVGVVEQVSKSFKDGWVVTPF